MTDTHKGIREFSAEELSGIALGQNGFIMVNNGTVTAGSGVAADVKYFVALKIVDADAEVEARSITPGEDLSLGGTGAGSYTGSNPVTLVNGDVVYGAFDLVKSHNATSYIMAYIGK
tara:strand:- start:27645 stop:27995 length:351 start_codon:yes stop_codon:yes gene_type:complete